MVTIDYLFLLYTFIKYYYINKMDNQNIKIKANNV